MLSARNQFKGVVKAVTLGQVMAEVVVDVAGLEFVSLISKASAEKMDLAKGKEVKVVVKATEVMVEN